MIATYRLQLGPHLTFADARAIVPYLKDLGVSHAYLSPSLQARSGSTHGYDVVDPTQVSSELGGEEQLRALAGEIGVVLDIVPNHMGTGDENRWWPDRDVFDFEPESDFYRRFFDIDDLGALRMDREEVFDLVHGKVLELVREGVLDGVRVDHPDGLADPAGYFARLRERGVPRIWIEKILHPGEPLREWAVDGTVGYEFLVDSTALFVDRASEELFTSLYGELTGETRDFEAIAREAQLELATTTFRRELAWLERLGGGRFSELEIADALATLPVYRTYVEPWSGRVDDLDRGYLAGLPEGLRAVLELRERGFDEFVTRFQQTSPPVTAKGVEDTAFYRYNRLLCLNEVGGDPGRFGIGVEDMHAANLDRAERFPENLLISSTHDTKRSGDVRMRIACLTYPGIRENFAALAREWVPRAPDPNEGWMLLQTLLGAHPIEPLERLDGFIEKALREAKVNTSWADQDTAYEARVQQWARSLLADADFRRDFDPLVAHVREAAEPEILGLTALKLTAPGIPDVYGGDEVSYHALVDPDNRRPIDFPALAAAPDSPKRALIRSLLALRARRPAAFAGAYEAVPAGPETLAFTRGDGEVLVVLGPNQLSLPGEWRDVFSTPRVSIRDRA